MKVIKSMINIANYDCLGKQCSNCPLLVKIDSTDRCISGLLCDKLHEIGYEKREIYVNSTQ